MFRAWTFTVNNLSKVETKFNLIDKPCFTLIWNLNLFDPTKSTVSIKIQTFFLFCLNFYSLVSSNCERLVLVQFQNLISFFYRFLILNIVFISQLLLSTYFHYKSLHLPPWAESKKSTWGWEMVELRAKMLYLLSLIQNIISKWFHTCLKSYTVWLF